MAACRPRDDHWCLVLVGGMGSIGANLYRLHQPAAALAQLEGVEVYACFNRPEKITPAMFADWLAILCQVPDSVLWVVNDHPLVEQRLRAKLLAAGLDPTRLVVSPKVVTTSFANYCSLADLLLDTSPYGSGATGLEALICPTPEAYVERAIALGRDPMQLQQQRQHLLDRGATLPLFDTAGWVRHWENLLYSLV